MKTQDYGQELDLNLHNRSTLRISITLTVMAMGLLVLAGF